MFIIILGVTIIATPYHHYTCFFLLSFVFLIVRVITQLIPSSWFCYYHDCILLILFLNMCLHLRVHVCCLSLLIMLVVIILLLLLAPLDPSRLKSQLHAIRCPAVTSLGAV